MLLARRNNLLLAIISLSTWICGCDEILNEPQSISMTNTPILLYVGGTQKCFTLDVNKNLSPTQYRCSTDIMRQNEIIEVEDKVYSIKSLSNGNCLEATGGKKLRLAPCTAGEDQKVTFRQSNIDFLFHKIVFAKSGKCLNVLNQDRADGAELEQATCSAKTSQDFFIAGPRSISRNLPKNIWTFWDKGRDAMPGFYKANLTRWEKILNRDASNGEWKIRVVNALDGDPNNWGNFIDKSSIPSLEYIASKIGTADFEKKLSAPVVLSDFIRLELLYEHGGIWLDPSIILHQNLDNIQNILQVLNNFTIAGFTSRSQATYDLRYADSMENFFMTAFPHLELVKTWKTNFRRYWDLKQPGMKIEDNPLFDGIKIDLSLFAGLADYLNQHIALKYTLMTNPRFLNEILILGGTSGSEKGPFTLLDLVGWNERRLLDLSMPEIDTTLAALQDVLMSKFPSDTSRNIRAKPESYFFEQNNFFGRLNSL